MADFKMADKRWLPKLASCQRHFICLQLNSFLHLHQCIPVWSVHFGFIIHLICRITQNNWIGVEYTPLERAFNDFIVTIFLHISYINNSCNFILYILTGVAFRKLLVETLTFCKKQNSQLTTPPKNVKQFCSDSQT